MGFQIVLDISPTRGRGPPLPLGEGGRRVYPPRRTPPLPLRDPSGALVRTPILLAALCCGCVGGDGGFTPPPSDGLVTASYSENPGVEFVGHATIEATNFPFGDVPGEYLVLTLSASARDIGAVGVRLTLPAVEAPAFVSGGQVRGELGDLVSPEANAYASRPIMDPPTEDELPQPVDAASLELVDSDFRIVVAAGAETLNARGHFGIGCVDHSSGTGRVDTRWETEFCSGVRDRWNLDAWIEAAR